MISLNSCYILYFIIHTFFGAHYMKIDLYCCQPSYSIVSGSVRFIRVWLMKMAIVLPSVLVSSRTSEIRQK